MLERTFTFTLVLILTTPVIAADCPGISYTEFQKWLTASTAKKRWLDIAICIEEQSQKVASTLESKGMAADEYRYLMATSMSNAIERGPLPLYNESAAGYWANYLSRVEPPIDTNRVDFGIHKLTQHARKVDFAQYIDAIWKGIRAVGKKLSGAAKISSGDTVLNTLYRCNRWDEPRETKIDVCTDHCLIHFKEFILSTVEFRALAHHQMTADQLKLRGDIEALQQRVQACTN
jgi:hypothetical protein